MGWADEDITGGGSDALIDALVAIGDAQAIVRRISDHLDAGADTVLIQLRGERSADLVIGGYREVAAAFGLQGPQRGSGAL